MTQQENEHTYTEQIAHAPAPPRYYLKHEDDEHEPAGYVNLIERDAIDNGDGPEDMILASFYDVYDRTTKESDLATFVCDVLNAGDALAKHAQLPGVIAQMSPTDMAQLSKRLEMVSTDRLDFDRPGLVRLEVPTNTFIHDVSGFTHATVHTEQSWQQKQAGYCSYGMSQAEHELAFVAQRIGLSGALFAFMGWLSTRDKESGPFSAHHTVGQAPTLIKQFCEMQGWPMPPDGWDSHIKPYIEPPDEPEEPPFYTPLSAESELARGMWPMQIEHEKPYQAYHEIGRERLQARPLPTGGFLEKAMRENAECIKPYTLRVSHEWLATHGYLPVDSNPGDMSLPHDDLSAIADVGFDEEEEEDEWEEGDEEDDDDTASGQPLPRPIEHVHLNEISLLADGSHGVGYDREQTDKPPGFVVPVRRDQRTCDHHYEVVPPDAVTVYRCDHCGLGYLDIKHPARFMGVDFAKPGEDYTTQLHEFPRSPDMRGIVKTGSVPISPESQKVPWTGTAQEYCDLMREDFDMGEPYSHKEGDQSFNLEDNLHSQIEQRIAYWSHAIATLQDEETRRTCQEILTYLVLPSPASWPPTGPMPWDRVPDRLDLNQFIADEEKKEP